MIGLTTEYKLASLLNALSNGEKDIEISRQVLAERSAFEPYTAFKRITRLATGSLTVYQVVDFLRENGIIALEKDVRNVFNLYSTSADGRLSYTDFLEVVLPRTNSVLRTICTQRDSYFVADDEVLLYEIEHGLAKILDKEVALSRRVELLKEDLVSRYDFSLRGSYEALVEAGDGRVDYDAFYRFLQKNSIPVIEKDILALLRRVDADRDGRLTFSEFCDAITPADTYYRRIAQDAPVQTRPVRVASPTRSTRYASPSKLTNSDYYDYLSESARKSSLRRATSLGRSASPTRLTQSYVASSPRRDLNKSGYLTPTRSRVASPSRGRSPSRIEPGSPMKGFEEDHLASALREQVDLDKELENTRNKLALQEDFNLFDAFRCFDLTEKGYVTKYELKDTLNDINIFPTNNELDLIRGRYNKDQDGLLKYSEFCEILKPKDETYARLLVNRPATYVDRDLLSEIFSTYTVELLRKVLNKVIENEYHSEKIRQRLSRRPLFDAFEAFEALDKNQNGSISKYEFRELLADHGFYATQKELDTLMNRYDRNEDGKVSYTEFVREIQPKSPERI
jgi:Ca2+-binding EF-hand superfamily protein